MSAGRRTEAGSAAVFVIGFAIVLFVAAGLVIDGGLALNARMRVADDAEQAARVGADSLDVDALRQSGEIVIDSGLAQQRAAQFLLTAGYTPAQFAVAVQPDQQGVRVQVQDTVPTGLLGLVQIDEFEVNASAVSAPQTGDEG
jgi:Flp pilus assembly protein TadG